MMKNSFVYFIIAIAAIGMIFSIFQPKYATSEKPISDVVQLAKLGKVSSIQVQNDNLIVLTNSGDIYKSRKEAGSSLLEIFQKMFHIISIFELIN